MKIFIRGVLFAALLVCFGCSEQTDITPNIEAKKSLDVKQAKEAFVRDYTAAVEARRETTRAQGHIYYTLADTDYTPLWDKAKNTENDHVLSIDVPLYSVSGAFVSDTIGENMRMATQKLIVIQSKKSGDTFSYLLTLCPDVACAEKYSDLNDVFTHLGDCSKFSGLAIYTSLAGELVAVNKFVNGTEAGYVYVGNPEEDQHTLHHQAEHLMESMKFYLSSGPVTVTRGGGAGTAYEDLCADCLKNPCECDIFTVDRCWACGKPIIEHAIYGKCECYGDFDICPTCGRAKPQDGETGGAFCECPTDTERCLLCGKQKPKDGKCECEDEKGTDPLGECPICNKVTCICSPCPKCGDKTCTGCGTTANPPSDNENDGDNDYDNDDCEYCNHHCGGTCEAYCQTCQSPKETCTVHKCVGCGKFNYQCDCK